MATSGQVVSHNPPYALVRIRVRNESVEAEALVDTGFDGAVIVPEGFLDANELPDGRVRWNLADGRGALFPTFLGSIQIGMLGPFDVSITALGNEVLLGRDLTDQLTLTFDHGKTLTIAL